MLYRDGILSDIEDKLAIHLAVLLLIWQAGQGVRTLLKAAATQETYEKIRYSSTGPPSLQKTTEGVLAYKRTLNAYGNGYGETGIGLIQWE